MTIRPPWVTEARLRAECSGCGDCIQACPEAILVAARAGAPVVDFNKGACTFCRKCAEACPEAVFTPTDKPPWNQVASIGADCLLDKGVACQSCQDACDVEALRFDYGVGPAGAMSVVEDQCTGCGACVSICPTRAIVFRRLPDEVAA